MRRRTFGRPKLGDLTGWSLVTIFGTVVVRGQVRGEPFTAAVLCFDGVADHPTSLLWTDKGRVRVSRQDRESWLLLGGI